MATSDKDENFVGIAALKLDWSQPGIERCGPPPGNTGILKRGEADWVFGHTTKKEIYDPRILRQEKKPTYDEMALALAREMAWRWFYGRQHHRGNEIKPGKQGILKNLQNSLKYADAERGFIEQFRNLYPGTPSMVISETVQGAVSAKARRHDCQCVESTHGGAGVCCFCTEG